MVTQRFPSFFFASALLCFFFAGGRSQAQTGLDPEELRALNLIFSRWGISSSLSSVPWNTSGNVCSGGALGNFQTFDDPNFNPGILCDCRFNNNATCHITRLKASELGIIGNIPEELQTFKYLDNLDLSKNYLTGPLPAFFGNFTAMKYLSMGFNSLSGSLPKELGKLHNLISLGIGINNFSGPVPPEIGNMSSLEQIYLDSLGITGEIPSSFSQLKKLKFMFASDNSFHGAIPDFIGNLGNLISLRLQGNSFHGPIPSSLANLTQLTELRLGDMVNGSSSLAFIANMKSLSTLILRNCRISDTIPLNFDQYTSLEYLDLSFNNLTGTIPETLFEMDSLISLFLGDNSLSGTLPNEKSPGLLNIDLSHNELSGHLPKWITQDNLALNLVANRFVIDKANRKIVPWTFGCLQKNFPCNRGSPIYYSFAVNCGGNEVVTSSDGTDFETDFQNLSSASYYVSDGTRWAVSSVGSLLETPDRTYIYHSSPSQFKNVSDSELYETSRFSTSSLRYYGLGLENGNYTVKLHFAETAFPNNRTWKSIGRRVFDIYIQGNLKAKDFDIRKQADGLSFRPVKKEYAAYVTNNYLEIHLFWAGKGTCCVPTRGTSGPLVSAVSVTPNFKPTVSNRPPSAKEKSKGLVIGIVIGIATLFSIIICGTFIWRRKRRLHTKEDEDLAGLNINLNYFTYGELSAATEGFSPSNKLGEGGFGSVFKGKLSDGRAVAVKQLSEASLQGKSQFIAEVAIISHVQHRNLVNLYGCCYEGDKRLLVYEYLENKSLDQILFENSGIHLDWPTRFEICLGMARGLAYLNEDSKPRIVHRDVKASNILLDRNLKPKISDFGLAKLYDDQTTHISTRVAGTIGYLAPEYAMRGHLTEKVDVFAFGVTALEILCGRRNTESSVAQEKMYLLEWAWTLHEQKNVLQLMDPSLSSYDKDEAMRVIGIALLCTQAFSSQRPPMSRVVAMLVGDVEVSEVTSKPAYLSDWQFDDVTDPSMSCIRGECSTVPRTSCGQSTT